MKDGPNDIFSLPILSSARRAADALVCSKDLMMLSDLYSACK